MHAPPAVQRAIRHFLAALPPRLRPRADEWLVAIGAIRRSRRAWPDQVRADVFFGAPAMLAEVVPEAPVALAEAATFAHFLAAFELALLERIDDRRARASAESGALLTVARHLRHDALAAVLRESPRSARRTRNDDGLGADDPTLADAMTYRSVAQERDRFGAGVRVGIADFEALTLSKLAILFPPTVAMARALGLERQKRALAHRTLRALLLADRLHEEAVTWERRHAAGRSWAVLLAEAGGARARDARVKEARAERGTPRDQASNDLTRARSRVHRADVVPRMLERAARRYHAARLRLRCFGPERLSLFAKNREAYLQEAARAERANPGFVVRANALAGWAEHVFWDDRLSRRAG